MNEKQANLAAAMLQLWEEIASHASEGEEPLALLLDALRHTSAPSPTPTAAGSNTELLLGSLGKLDESWKASASFNQALTDIKPHLHWYTNSVFTDSHAADAQDNYCCNLVGRTTQTQTNPFLLHNDNIMIGLFLLGPERLYPEHQHPATELYLVLSGHAQWKRGDQPWQIRQPGEYFVHTSQQSHAMRTGSEPLLALWVWTGDLQQWARWS